MTDPSGKNRLVTLRDWRCEDCAADWLLDSDPPDDAECDSCGGRLVAEPCGCFPEHRCHGCGHDLANHYEDADVRWCANCDAPCAEPQRGDGGGSASQVAPGLLADEERSAPLPSAEEAEYDEIWREAHAVWRAADYLDLPMGEVERAIRSAKMGVRSPGAGASTQGGPPADDGVRVRPSPTAVDAMRPADRPGRGAHPAQGAVCVTHFPSGRSIIVTDHHGGWFARLRDRLSRRRDADGFGSKGAQS